MSTGEIGRRYRCHSALAAPCLACNQLATLVDGHLMRPATTLEFRLASAVGSEEEHELVLALHIE